MLLHDVDVSDVTQTFGGTHCNTVAVIFVYESRPQVLQVKNTCHYVRVVYVEYQPDGTEFGTIMESKPYISYTRSSTTGDCRTQVTGAVKGQSAPCARHEVTRVGGKAPFILNLCINTQR
jgi:hypothetical protein